MLQSIEIENFRCFEKASISGFEQINLITGKNNSGKTALLEAIYSGTTSDYESIKSISRNSSRDLESLKYLFFNQNHKDSITIKLWHDSFHGAGSLFRNKDTVLGIDYAPSSSRFKLDKERTQSDAPIFTSAIGITYNVNLILDKDIQIPEINLIQLFDSADKNGYSENIKEALKIIDKQIVDIKTFSSYPDVFYMSVSEKIGFQPIYYFGDAIQKIVRYVINIITYEINEKTHNILLIDEIENGIHYTAQAEVWRMLMKLCKHFNIQLFATTHSLEMIKAFQSVCAEEEFKGMGGYFELGRNPKSQQIIGIKHDLETLEYELASGDTIRGE